MIRSGVEAAVALGMVGLISGAIAGWTGLLSVTSVPELAAHAAQCGKSLLLTLPLTLALHTYWRGNNAASLGAAISGQLVAGLLGEKPFWIKAVVGRNADKVAGRRWVAFGCLGSAGSQ